MLHKWRVWSSHLKWQSKMSPRFQCCFYIRISFTWIILRHFYYTYTLFFWYLTLIYYCTHFNLLFFCNILPCYSLWLTKITVPFAYNSIDVPICKFSRWFTYNTKSSGPKIVSWGIAYFISAGSELELSMQTHSVLLKRKVSTNLSTIPIKL